MVLIGLWLWSFSDACPLDSACYRWGFGLGCFFGWRLQDSSNLDHGSSRVNIWRLLSYFLEKARILSIVFRLIFVKIAEGSSCQSPKTTLEAPLRRVHDSYRPRSPNTLRPNVITFSSSFGKNIWKGNGENLVIGMALGGLWRDYFGCLFFIPIFYGKFIPIFMEDLYN